MLLIEELVKSYPMKGGQAVKVLEAERFEMKPGEKVAIVGPSGSGKSTLLHLISGVLRPTSGSIQLLGHELGALSEAELDRFRAKHIGYVFQSFNLLPGFSALENVQAAMGFGRKIPARERKARAAELLGRVGLGHRLNHRSHQLSQGEQQRVSIARALANRPAIVLADEPTASLDGANARQVYELLAEACGSEGAALLLSTHDMELAKRLDRVVPIRKLAPGRREDSAAYPHSLAQSV
ncbi:ABC transporter ATP-binding protein [Cohnella thailandensis]|uniref:ABC transporter ATP-binding protein n=1 Tax=Cohnella thailandensis TaxID=557557 RepID=A0A841SW53_9BACL|nr:ABC transporter ATP-binding protein [Cohnella thailandensis]MBB6634846.1 ABC transporter ATP-binding protein [Cohnella thailandensis]MBP1975933.1 ABC-type lipoprotein export system ATPase subunit [Cohnella thailandensis]